MKCFDELAYAMFLDNELEPGERQKVAAHLEQCRKCRELVRQLEEENQRLTTAFETDEKTPDLVPGVMVKLRAPESHRDNERKRIPLHTAHTARWLMAAAASVVLAGFLFIFLWLDKTPADPRLLETETQVLICKAQVEGHDVQSHIVNSDDPDIKFIWFEKL
ncbi:MAG: hypothetical protein GY950_17480 [bacterium]|nr:hypothetical protein [bacterium]